MNETAAPGPALAALQADLHKLASHYAGRQALLKDRAGQLRQEADQLQREIQQLRTGDRAAGYEAEAPQSSRLRRLLRADLGLPAAEVTPLYEALVVPDESWQDAVEGLHRFRRLK